MKRYLITLLKFGISFSILGYLFYWARQDEHFHTFVDQPKDWYDLSAAFAIGLIAVLLTFVRWFLLVRALEIPFTLQEAFRLGFLGSLFSYLALGIVGGDAVRTVFVARRHPQRLSDVITTVLLDRAIGLFGLIIVASLAFLCFDLTSIQGRAPGTLIAVQRMNQFALALGIAGLVGGALILLSGLSFGLWFDWIGRVPKVGPMLDRIIEAIRIYRGKPAVLIVALILSMLTQGLFVVSVYLIARGIPGDQPTLGTYFSIVPIAMLGNAVPLPAGLGGFEAAFDALYRGVSSPDMPASQGLLTAFGFRLISLVITLVGAVYYMMSRQEVTELIEQAKQVERSSSLQDNP